MLLDDKSWSQAMDHYAQHRWCQIDSALPQDILQSLHNSIQNAKADGLLQSAKVGRQNTELLNPSIRGDSILWVDAARDSGHQAAQALFSELQQRLNQDFYLGLKRFECHFASYPPGAGYQTHLDQHQGRPGRQVSAILYLNHHWQSEFGGELVIYAPPSQEKEIAHILPLWGRLVLFQSDTFYHQVLASTQERCSLTGWLRNDAL